MLTLVGNIISKNGGDGIVASSSNAIWGVFIVNNTIDGNSGNGITVSDADSLSQLTCINNIISNHTTSGKYPISVLVGTTTPNDRVKNFIDYNVFYNNLNAPNAISYGTHDTTGGADPYVNQSLGDYTLTSTYKDAGYSQANLPGY